MRPQSENARRCERRALPKTPTARGTLPATQRTRKPALPEWLDSERQLLGGLLNWPEHIARAEGIEAASFVGPHHAALWDALAALDREGRLDKGGSFLTVWQRIEADGHNRRFAQLGNEAYLAELTTSIASPARLPDLIRVVVGEASRRKLAVSAEEAPARDDDEQPEQPTARPIGKPPIKGVRCMADIMPERINWLWPGYLAAGKLSLLIGDPGLGKSTLTCEIVARLSRGEALPGTPQPPAPLICGLCCPEDDPADTIRPRLDAAAVELERVFVLDEVRTFPNELPQLEAFIRQHSLGLVVIDPIMSFLSGKHDSHRDQDVRRALTPLVELAQKTGCAVLAVMHQNKRQGVAAMYRAGGSIGFVGLARTAMMLAQDPDDPERRVLAQVKNNLAKERKAHRLRLNTRPGHEVAAIEWLGECDLRADDLCGPPEGAESRSALHDAKEFLREQLADGPKPRAEVMTAGKKEGHAERTLRRARREIGIANSAAWALPTEHAPKGAEG